MYYYIFIFRTFFTTDWCLFLRWRHCNKNKKLKAFEHWLVCFSVSYNYKMSIAYKGFTITTNRIDEMDRLKKTVDDYEEDFKQTPMDVDAARVDMAQRCACKMVAPMSADQAIFLRRTVLGLDIAGTIAPAVMPTRIGLKHVTQSSRVRNLVHGGMLGLLSVRLMSDSSTQVKRRSRTYQSLSVIRRANNQAGCAHVRWSIPEFQRRFNMQVNGSRTGVIENPFLSLSITDAIAKFGLMNTQENRARFLAECAAYANEPTHSRIVASTRHVLSDRWIMHLLFGFQKICSHHMSNVMDLSLKKIDRSVNLIKLYRFMMSSVGWIFSEPCMNFAVNLTRLYDKYIDRLVYMSKEGVEHAACLMGLYFPEMMTPELHVCVNPTDLYRVPQMEIGEDDALFGPLKATYQAIMPAAANVVAASNVVAATHAHANDDDHR